MPSAVQAQVTFNGGPITIVDNAPATPSVITVSGYQGTITGFSVTLSGFSHTYTVDVAALIVGPVSGSQNTLLFDGPGIESTITPTIANNLTLEFRDNAAAT